MGGLRRGGGGGAHRRSKASIRVACHGMDIGRRMHREQIAEVFAPQLATRPAAQQQIFVDLLVVATDVYTWKLLRRDRGLDQATVEARVRQLIAGILNNSPQGA